MKPLPLLLTHLIVLLVAFFATRGITSAGNNNGDPRNSNANNTTDSSTPSKASRANESNRANELTHRHRTPAEYADAWNALPGKRLTRAERQKVQLELLQAWAEVDLKGALAAALNEPWHDISWNGNIEEFLDKAFSDALVDQTPDVWKLIDSQDLGILESALVRKTWINAITKKDPQLLTPYLRNLKSIVLSDALRTLGSHLKSPEEAQALWNTTSQLSDDALTLDALQNLARSSHSHFSLDELKQNLTSSNDTILTLTAKSLALKLASSEEAIATINELPEALRAEFALDLIRNTRDNELIVPDALNHLIENNHWNLVKDPSVTRRVRELAEAGDASAIAAWAVELPERIEAKEIIHRSVAPFAKENPDAAWDWLATLDNGLWRDRAYAEFSQQVLWNHKDPTRSQQALDQISDPEFHQEALNWRREWERRTGWKPNNDN